MCIEGKQPPPPELVSLPTGYKHAEYPGPSCYATMSRKQVPEPTVPGETQETALFLGGSLQQGTWVAAKVTTVYHHPVCERGVTTNYTDTKASTGIQLG